MYYMPQQPKLMPYIYYVFRIQLNIQQIFDTLEGLNTVVYFASSKNAVQIGIY